MLKATASIPRPLNLDTELDGFIEESRNIIKKYGGEKSEGN